MSDIAIRVASRWLLRKQATVRFKGKLHKSSKIIYKAFVEGVVGTGLTVYLHPRKSLGKMIGYVKSDDLAKGVAHIYFVDGWIQSALNNIGHELIHVLQYKRGDLAFEKDAILWKGEHYMSKAEYDAISSYATHAKLPWEAQANREGEAKAQAFLKTIPSLRGQDPTLDYLIDNDLV